MITETLGAQGRAYSLAFELSDEHAKLLDQAEFELGARAAFDADGCYGYFPSLNPGRGLTHTQRFASAMPRVVTSEGELSLNFLRYSTRPYHPIYGLHLDTDASTAVTGPAPSTCPTIHVVRLLLNAHSEWERRVLLAPDVDYDSLVIDYHDGYAGVAAGVSGEDAITVPIPPRNGTTIAGVCFRANIVPHRGDQAPNFVIGYGAEIPV